MASALFVLTFLTGVLLVTTVVESVELCFEPNPSQPGFSYIPCPSAGSTRMFLQGQQYVSINGLCLSSYGYNYYAGARFILWQCLNQSNQIWQSTLISQEQRSVQLMHVESGMCLSASGACGQVIDMRVCATNPATTAPEQVWIAPLL